MASWASINPVKSEYGTFLCSINFLPDLVAQKIILENFDKNLFLYKVYLAKTNSNHLSHTVLDVSVTNHGKNGFARWRIQDGRTKKD